MADDFKGFRLLVIDDDPLQLEVLSAQVEGLGAECDCASDGEQAFSILKAAAVGHYDMVISDIFMPGMRGFELAAKFRALERTDAATLPIIGVSADTDPDLYDRAISAGMNGMSLKPVSVRALSAYMTLMLKEGRVNSVFASRIRERVLSEHRMREFVRSVCRNLRGPMRAIMGFAEMLGMDDVSEEDRRNWADAVSTACQSANKVLNDAEISYENPARSS